jgi:hypothetical protein
MIFDRDRLFPSNRTYSTGALAFPDVRKSRIMQCAPKGAFHQWR